jgi:carboxypeptidase T
MVGRIFGWAGLLLWVSAAGAGNDDALSVVRVHTTDRAIIQQLASRHGHLIVAREKGIVLFDADAREIERLRISGLRFEIDADATAKLHESAQVFVRAKAGIPGYSCYRTVVESNARLTQLQSLYPALVAVSDIGDSWEKTAGIGGEDLRVIRVTNGATPGPKPVMFMMTAIHAREYATAEVGLRFVEWLLANYGTNADATWILDTQEIHLLVQSNPDGRKRAETGLSWRKNTDNGYCANSNNRGVDLNRNFPFEWGNAQDGQGSSTSPCDPTFRGPSAASEPESAAIVNYVRSIFPDQRGPLLTDAAPLTAQGLFLDIHSYSQLVLWPWGWTLQGNGGRAPNNAQLVTLGRRFAWFNDYEPEQANDLYLTDGATDDNAYGDLGVAAYTFELGTAFFESCSSFESSTNPINFAALLYGARIARAPYRWPAGPEARSVTATPDLVVTGEPVTVNAVADDSRFNQRNGGTEVAHPIASASAYVGLAPWQAGALAQPLSASDGSFNASSESLQGAVSTAGLPSGRHVVYVQARDGSGADGAPSAALIDVATAAEIATVQGVVSNAATGAVVPGAIVSIGSGSSISAVGTGAYSRRVRGGTFDVRASATDFEPYLAPGIAIAAGTTVTRDIQMYPLCQVLAENAENGTNGWTTQVTSGSNTFGIINANAVTTTRAWTESVSGNYTSNANTQLISPIVNMTGYTAPVLSFDSYCDTESGFDYGIVEISATPGTWTEAYRCDAKPTWQRIALDVPSLAGATQARVRFRFTSDSSETDDGWYIDNITLKAGGPTCRAAVVSAPGAPDLLAANDSGLSAIDDITNAATLVVAGACTNGDSIQLRANGSVVGSPMACAAAAYSLSFSPAEGTFALTTRATRGGIDSPDSTALTVIVDRTAPAVPAISMPGVSYPSNVTILGTMSENDGTVSVLEGVSPVCQSAPFTPVSGNAWSCVATLSAGSHSIRARHVDAAGNASMDSPISVLTISEALFADSFE